MSSVLAWLRLDGAPADPTVLDRMIAALEHRGPQGTHTRTLGPVTLAHAGLHTSDGLAGSDMQPFVLDEGTYVVADARLDARNDLLAALGAGGQQTSPDTASDAELIACAYRRWGVRSRCRPPVSALASRGSIAAARSAR